MNCILFGLICWGERSADNINAQTQQIMTAELLKMAQTQQSAASGGNGLIVFLAVATALVVAVVAICAMRGYQQVAVASVAATKQSVALADLPEQIRLALAEQPHYTVVINPTTGRYELLAGGRVAYQSQLTASEYKQLEVQ